MAWTFQEQHDSTILCRIKWVYLIVMRLLVRGAVSGGDYWVSDYMDLVPEDANPNTSGLEYVMLLYRSQIMFYVFLPPLARKINT
jgi:hypothetical protein